MTNCVERVTSIDGSQVKAGKNSGLNSLRTYGLNGRKSNLAEIDNGPDIFSLTNNS